MVLASWDPYSQCNFAENNVKQSVSGLRECIMLILSTWIPSSQGGHPLQNTRKTNGFYGMGQFFVISFDENTRKTQCFNDFT